MFIKFINNRTGKNISIFTEKSFKSFTIFYQVAYRFIGNKYGFKHLGAAKTTFLFGSITGKLDNFKNHVTHFTGKPLIEFHLSVDQRNFVGNCRTVGISCKNISNL